MSNDNRQWVVLHRPGLVPQTKGPFHQRKLTEEMLRELYRIYPDAICDVIALSSGQPPEPYVDSGREYLSIIDAERCKCIVDRPPRKNCPVHGSSLTVK